MIPTLRVVLASMLFALGVHAQIPIPPSPIPNAGADQSREALELVGLDGRGTTPLAAITTWSWSQLVGPAITLEDASSPTPWFRAPSVTVSTLIRLKLTVTANNGTSASDQIDLTIVPRPAEFQGTADSLLPYGDALTHREIQHLMRRAAFDGGPSLYAMISSNGLTGAVDNLLSGIFDDAVRDAAHVDVGLAPSPCDDNLIDPDLNQPIYEYTPGNVTRYAMHMMLHDEANPLVWRLWYFWHDRLATSTRNLGPAMAHFRAIHADLLAKNALTTNYLDFLQRFTKDGAELVWLNGDSNKVNEDAQCNPIGIPNENYAREFLELFALGDSRLESGVPVSNYDQNDIVQLALCFSGWTFENLSSTQTDPCYNKRKVAFRANNHFGCDKTLFAGQPWAATGNFGVDQAVDAVLGHPAAARYVARNLFTYFCGYTPSETTEKRLALLIEGSGTSGAHDWDLRPTIRVILRSQALFSSQARRARVRRPMDMFLGACQRTGIKPPLRSQYGEWVEILDLLGHQMLNPPAVNGWPEAEKWLTQGGFANRMKMVNTLITYARSDSAIVNAAVARLRDDDAGLRDAATWIASLARELGFDLDHLPTTALRDWITELNAGTPGSFDLDDQVKREAEGMRGLYLALITSLDQVR